MKLETRHSKLETRRAFSLVEVLLAVFILGIGMIMVASVFPVGATWTRQTAEESVGQTVAQNALTVLRTHYGPNGNLHYFFNPDYGILGNMNSILRAGPFGPPNAPPGPFVLQAPPGFTQIPPTERAYQFGSTNPFPAPNVAACTYFWTALMRLNPAHLGGNTSTNFIMPSSTYKYDVFILVFRKGAAEQQFTLSGPLPTGYAEIIAARDFDNSGNINGSEVLLPPVGYAPWSQGTYAANQSPSIINAVPPIGQYGIGAYSGTVFRQVADVSTNYQTATPRPLIITSPQWEPVIYSPAADGTASSASPLIYIYQTTMSF